MLSCFVNGACILLVECMHPLGITIHVKRGTSHWNMSRELQNHSAVTVCTIKGVYIKSSTALFEVHEKSSICLYFKDSQFFLSFCEVWLCSPKEVCEMTWTIQGTHAKCDAQNTFSMSPSQSSGLWQFHFHSARMRCLSIRGCVSNFHQSLKHDILEVRKPFHSTWDGQCSHESYRPSGNVMHCSSNMVHKVKKTAKHSRWTITLKS